MAKATTQGRTNIANSAQSPHTFSHFQRFMKRVGVAKLPLSTPAPSASVAAPEDAIRKTADGIIAVLGKIYAAGIAREKTGWLLEQAVRWFLRQRLPAEMNSCFSGFYIPGQPSGDCRLAWCYGDAGIAAALFIAGRCTGQSSWEEEALAIARHSANRAPETCRVRDVCFCHGSAGLAHIFNRFYQVTHDELFAGASRYWIDQSVQYRKPGSGVAGPRREEPN